MWSLVDFIIIICNIYTSLDHISHYDVKYARVVESFLVLSMFFKCLYFLRLVPEISPLVDIIVTILWQIRYFLLIFIIFLIGFSQAFWIIGRHHSNILIYKDGKTENEIIYLPYGYLSHSFFHVYQNALGETDSDTYVDNEMTPVFIILFFLMILILTVHLLNMLIAIMRDTYKSNNEIAESKKKIS